MNLFISYRRQDSAPRAGRLFETLASRYGAEHVFIDMETIQPGVDFRDHIHHAIIESGVVILVIGSGWTGGWGSDSEDSLLAHPGDYIRNDIAEALKANKPIIPVLVGGAFMPDAHHLPPEIRQIAKLQTLSISDSSWNQDTRGLFELIEEKTGVAEEKTEVAEEKTGVVEKLLRRLRGLFRRRSR